MKILFTICGRAGSKGFKNKNLKEINHIPLLYYTLAVILGYIKSNPHHQVLVALNTDSDSLKELIQKQNILSVLCVERRERLAGDIVPKVEVIQDTYLQMIEFAPDVVVDLDITSPCRRVADLENIIQVYSAGKYDIVFSVVQARRNPYFNMVEKKRMDFIGRFVNLLIQPGSKRRNLTS